VADAVDLARALGQLPERLIVYAVEGCRFEPGAPQSPEVVAAAEPLAARVVLEVLELVSRPGAYKQTRLKFHHHRLHPAGNR
jgi:hypothetical protein